MVSSRTSERSIHNRNAVKLKARRAVKWLPSVLGWAAVLLLIPFHYGAAYVWLSHAGLFFIAGHAFITFGGSQRFPFWYSLVVFTVQPLVFNVGLGFWATPALLVLLLIRSAIDRRRQSGGVERQG